MVQALSSIKLDKSIPVPLYYQLKKQILSLFENASLQEGDILPPENELCETLNVSRPTIRQAFNELAMEGYLARYKGRGTFVCKPKVEEKFFNRLQSFNAEMISKGLIPKTEVLGLERLNGPHEANERLNLPLSAALIRLSRLRWANDTPLVYVETFLPFDRYRALMDVDFRTTSLYQSLDNLCHVRVNKVRREIEAVNARKKEAKLLQIAQNKALILVKTVAYSEDDSLPVEFSIARYRGDRNKFSVDILGYYLS
ncbi:MAG: GntR family transcriptional regulator [Treponema sp.]|jgi:GntR family transcriptional regulator|nr:GntR family transcriptional regulator [Treponema sp.]